MTERVDQLIASKDTTDFDLLAALDDTDREDALSRALDPTDPNRARAMAILAAIDPDPAGALAQVLGTALGELGADPYDLAAGIALAVSLGPAAAPLVVPAVQSENIIVALSAWRTLEKIAGEDLLEPLRAMAPPPGDALGDQAAFALSVIAYRARTTGFELAAPTEDLLIAIAGDATELIGINQDAVGGEDFDLLTNLSGGELYGLVPGIDATTAIDCGEDHMLLCVDPDLQASLPSGGVLQFPALLGLVALHNPLGEDYSVQHLVLTWPDEEGGFHAGVYDPGGSPAYYGHARSDLFDENGEQVTFSLFALFRPGVAPVSLSIEANSSGVSLTGERLSVPEVPEGADRLVP